MKKSFGIFTDADETFSWRKGLTCMVAFVFLYSCIAYIYGAKELPSGYQTIIGLVFAFYFMKEGLRNFKLTKK